MGETTPYLGDGPEKFSIRYLLWNGRVLDFDKAPEKQGTLNQGNGKSDKRPAPPPKVVVNVKKGAPLVTPSPKVSVRIVSTEGLIYPGVPSRIAVQLRLKREAAICRLLFRVYKQFKPENKAHDKDRLVYQELLDHGQVLALPTSKGDLPKGGVTFDPGSWADETDLPYRVVVWVSTGPKSFDVRVRDLLDPGEKYDKVEFRGRTVHDQSGALWDKDKLNDKLFEQTSYKFKGLIKVKKKRPVELDELGVNLIGCSSFGLDLLDENKKVLPVAAAELGAVLTLARGTTGLRIRPIAAGDAATGVKLSTASRGLRVYTKPEASRDNLVALPKSFPKAEIPPEGLLLYADTEIGGTEVRGAELLLELEGGAKSKATLPFTQVTPPEAVTRFFSEAPRSLKLKQLIDDKVLDRADEAHLKTGFHGTASSLLSVWSPGNFSLLSLKELSARGIAQVTGEGDSNSGQAGLKEEISIGLDSKGLGIACAYSWATSMLPTYNVSLFTDEELKEEYRLAKAVVDAHTSGIKLSSPGFNNDRFLQEAKVQAGVHGCQFMQVVGHVTGHKALENTGGYAKRLKDEIDHRAKGGATVAPFGMVFEFRLRDLDWERQGSMVGEGTVKKEIPLDKTLRRVYAPRGELPALMTKLDTLAPKRALVGVPFEGLEHLAPTAEARTTFSTKVNELVGMSRAMRAALRAMERALSRAPQPKREPLPRPLTLPPSKAVAAVPGIRVAMAAVTTWYEPKVDRTVDQLLAMVDTAQSEIDKDGGQPEDLHIFLAPEWWFRKSGATPYTHAEMRAIIEELKTKSGVAKYDRWVIAAGSIYFGLGYEGALDTPDAPTALNDVTAWFKLKNQKAKDDSPIRVEPTGTLTHYLVGNVGAVVHKGALVNHRFKVFEHDIADSAKASGVEQWAFQRLKLSDALALGGRALFTIPNGTETVTVAHEICRDHIMQAAAIAHARTYGNGGPGGPAVNGVDIHLLVCNDVGPGPSSIIAKDGGYLLRCDGKGDDDKQVLLISRKAPPQTNADLYTERFEKEDVLVKVQAEFGALNDEALETSKILHDEKSSEVAKKKATADRVEIDKKLVEVRKRLDPAIKDVAEKKKAIDDAGVAQPIGRGSLGNIKPLPGSVYLWSGKIFPDE